MRSKYKNVRTAGFASKREANRAQELSILQFAGIISRLRTQVRFPIVVNEVKICDYIADFTYRDEFGKDVVEDVKGFKTPIYRLKKKLLWAVSRIDIKET